MEKTGGGECRTLELASFKLKLTGDMSDRHEIEAYDGFTALAGAAWTLSLITNYVETGEIRHRGDFVGRHAVHAKPMRSGSIIADFAVLLQSQPSSVFEVASISAGASGLLYGLVHRVIARNIGIDPDPLNNETAALLSKKSGDIEALVAITEPSLRRAHDVIGNGANDVEWIGGFDPIAHMNESTKAFMKASVHDSEQITKDVSVSGFYGNSGHGGVFDFDLNRTVPFSMTKDVLSRYGSYFSWGLHQYTSKTGKTIKIKFTRILALDGRPKKYVIMYASANE
ncbi:DUF7946 domain-containing protein [Sphingopyxis sp. 550A]